MEQIGLLSVSFLFTHKLLRQVLLLLNSIETGGGCPAEGNYPGNQLAGSKPCAFSLPSHSAQAQDTVKDTPGGSPETLGDNESAFS